LSFSPRSFKKPSKGFEGGICSFHSDTIHLEIFPTPPTISPSGKTRRGGWQSLRDYFIFFFFFSIAFKREKGRSKEGKRKVKRR